MSALNRPPITRRRTRVALVGGIQIGGGAPIVVQSMTNTDTADIAATVAQVKALADAGSELVRIAVNTAEAAAAVPAIRERLDAMSLQGAADRRLSFQRPQAAVQLPGLRAGAREVPDQSRQRRQGHPPRSAVRGDDRAGDRLRQAGAHRRQLGQPRPGPAGEPDGRERASRRIRSTPPTSCARRS